MKNERKSSEKKQAEYYKQNREAWNEYQREYKKRRYAEDPVYRARIKEYHREYRLSKKREKDA
jgi:hypothetical protein